MPDSIKIEDMSEDHYIVAEDNFNVRAIPPPLTKEKRKIRDIAPQEDNNPPPISREKRKSKKPKVISEWTRENIFKLITCVQKHPTLWDTSDSQYRNKHERTKLWNHISKNDFKSEFTGAELLAKWSNARIQFRSYAKRKSMGDPVAWKYYSAMEFIGHTDSESTAPNESNVVMNESNENSNCGVVSIAPPASAVTHSSRKRRGTTAVTHASSAQSSAETLAADIIKNAVDTLNQEIHKQQSCDEFETFGTFLASELRLLNDIAKARRIKRKVLRYFLDTIDAEQSIHDDSILVQH